MRTTLFLLALLSFGSCSIKQKPILQFSLAPIQIDSFRDSTEQIPLSESVLSDSSHFVWGGSVVQGEDGRFHMFYAIFDAGPDLPHFSDSWLLSSKIAYAVSDYPDRGFKFQKIVLRGAAAEGNPEAWDAQGVHNPHIKKFEGKYYLYYIGSRDPGVRPEGDPGAGLSARNRIQQVQAVSVIAVSQLEDLIMGNFTRPAEPLLRARTRVKSPPVIDPSPDGTQALPDNLIVVNPSVVYRPSDRKYLLYFKGNLYDPNWRGVHGVAVGEHPEGPFVALDEPVFVMKTEEDKLASAEDPYVWYHPGSSLFYAVFKDFQGHFTGEHPGLAVMISTDGLNWEMHPQRQFASKELALKNGGALKVSNLERPQFLINDKGEPVAMYAACSIGPCGPKKDGSTFNVQFRVSVE